MIRFLASRRMIAFELLLVGVAVGLLLPSTPAEALRSNLVALPLLAIAALLLAASIAATLLPIAASIWRCRSKRPVRTLEDPVFGTLELEDGLWASSPANRAHDFMVTIDAPEEGPSDLQRDFFRRITERRREYEEQATAFIVAECGKDGISINAATLRLYAIDIGLHDEIEDGRFVLEFVEPDEIVVHRVEFRNHVPHDYGMDD